MDGLRPAVFFQDEIVLGQIVTDLAMFSGNVDDFYLHAVLRFLLRRRWPPGQRQVGHCQQRRCAPPFALRLTGFRHLPLSNWFKRAPASDMRRGMTALMIVCASLCSRMSPIPRESRSRIVKKCKGGRRLPWTHS